MGGRSIRRGSRIAFGSNIDEDDFKRAGSELLGVLGSRNLDLHGVFASSDRSLFPGGGRGGYHGISRW